MKKVLFAIILFALTASAQQVDEESPFKQVSGHCYVLSMEENGENISFVATGQGVLLFDPPPEPDLSILVDYLSELSAGPVRWMVNTGFYPSLAAGVDYFAGRSAVLLSGFRQLELKMTEPEEPDEVAEPFEIPDAEPGFRVYDDPNLVVIPFPAPPENSIEDTGYPETEEPAWPQFIFKQRMYLFPDDLEIEIQELQHEARTGADIFAYVPDEKVLFTGRLFEPQYYPDIDVSTGGSALKWIDALEQVVDSVPLLISAIPPEEDEEEEEGEEKEVKEIAEEEEPVEGEEEEEEEKTLEEMITVISARGEVANLQLMKEVLDTSKKLRDDISRAIKRGRSCDTYLDSSAVNPYLKYGNFFPYAEQLCRELSPEEESEELEDSSQEPEARIQ